MDKINWIDGFDVSRNEQNFAFDGAEDGMRNRMVDAGAFGIASGYEVTPDTPTANLSVEVDLGVGYTAQGERAPLLSLTNVDCSVDEDDFSTAVVGGPGNERWIAVVARYLRAESQPDVVEGQDPFNLKFKDSMELRVRSASEAPIGTGARGVVGADEVLIIDVLLADGQTQIFTGDLNDDRVHPLVFRAMSDKALITSLEQVDGTTMSRKVRRFSYDAGKLPAGTRVFVDAFFRVDFAGPTGTITIRRISPADDIAVLNTTSTNVANKVRAELIIGDAANQLKTTLTDYEVELSIVGGPTDTVECTGLDLLMR